MIARWETSALFTKPTNTIRLFGVPDLLVVGHHPAGHSTANPLTIILCHRIVSANERLLSC